MLDQEFTAGTLHILREAVLVHATAAGLPEARAADVMLAVHELAANAGCRRHACRQRGSRAGMFTVAETRDKLGHLAHSAQDRYAGADEDRPLAGYALTMAEPPGRVAAPGEGIAALVLAGLAATSPGGAVAVNLMCHGRAGG